MPCHNINTSIEVHLLYEVVRAKSIHQLAAKAPSSAATRTSKLSEVMPAEQAEMKALLDAKEKQLKQEIARRRAAEEELKAEKIRNQDQASEVREARSAKSRTERRT